MIVRDIRNLIRGLQELPRDRRSMLVVRSMPFGDLIEDDTRRVHFATPAQCKSWPGWSYRVLCLVKREHAA